MKRKIFGMFLVLTLSVISAFAEDVFKEIDANFKFTTLAYNASRYRTYSFAEAVEEAMDFTYWFEDDALFEAEVYEMKQLLESEDFNDDYAYGGAISALLKLHYGLVLIFYNRYDDEIVSIMGWDVLEFVALEDGRFLCLKGEL